MTAEELDGDSSGEEALQPSGPAMPPGAASELQGSASEAVLPGEAAETSPASQKTEEKAAFDGLDGVHLAILQALLRGETADGQIRREHLMPALVTDTINEAFYDEIGDNILEYDGDRISLIEDYREDIAAILGGKIP